MELAESMDHNRVPACLGQNMITLVFSSHLRKTPLADEALGTYFITRSSRVNCPELKLVNTEVPVSIYKAAAQKKKPMTVCTITNASFLVFCKHQPL